MIIVKHDIVFHVSSYSGDNSLWEISINHKRSPGEERRTEGENGSHRGNAKKRKVGKREH